MNKGIKNLDIPITHFEDAEVLKAIKSAKIVHCTDPGHGWYSVPVSLLRLLGIEGEVSGSSCLRGKRAYLEEDADGSLLVRAIRKIDPEFVIKTTYSDKSPIRNYGTYDKELAELNLKDPMELIGLKLYQASSYYEIVEFRNHNFYLTQNGGSQKYKVKETDLSKFFITEGMKKRDQAIEAVYEKLKEELIGLDYHFYTKDNVCVTVILQDKDSEPVKTRLDYTIRNKNFGMLKVKDCDYKEIIMHEEFINFAKKLSKKPHFLKEIENSLMLLQIPIE